jgi:biopolymer transport protein ExbB/TolQ
MNVLASTGSTAPFVGLLGTVLGIINALRGSLEGHHIRQPHAVT